MCQLLLFFFEKKENIDFSSQRRREEEKLFSFSQKLKFSLLWIFFCQRLFQYFCHFSHSGNRFSLSLSLSLSLFCAPFIRMSISMKIIVVVAVEVATGTIQVIYLGHRTQRKQGSSLRHFLRQQKEWNTEPQDVVHKLSSCANQQQQTQKMGKYKNHWNASDQKKIAKCL